MGGRRCRVGATIMVAGAALIGCSGGGDGAAGADAAYCALLASPSRTDVATMVFIEPDAGAAGVDAVRTIADAAAATGWMVTEPDDVRQQGEALFAGAPAEVEVGSWPWIVRFVVAEDAADRVEDALLADDLIEEVREVYDSRPYAGTVRFQLEAVAGTAIVDQVEVGRLVGFQRLRWLDRAVDDDRAGELVAAAPDAVAADVEASMTAFTRPWDAPDVEAAAARVVDDARDRCR